MKLANYIGGLVVAGTMSVSLMAGNPDRAGQAGATELLINSFARSAGWANANLAGVRGLESTLMNVAGLAFTKGTEVMFHRTNWLVPSGININSFGLAQQLSSGAMSLSLNSFSFGDIPITTVEQPEGGLGTFRPQFINVGLAYSHKFTESISGGLLMRFISQEVVNVRATGLCIDAGVQYVTSSKPSSKSVKRDDIKIGVSLRNVGSNMTYAGDGLSIRARFEGNEFDNAVNQRAASFELPTVLQIGSSYDFRLDKAEGEYFNRLTLAANFISNSFSYNQFGLGLEYAYKEFLMVRTGYLYENNIFNAEERRTAFTGLTAGATIEFPLSKETGSYMAVDYAYRATNPFQGCHTFGLKLIFGGAD